MKVFSYVSLDVTGGFLYVIRDEKQLKVFFRDCSFLHHFLQHRYQRFKIFFSDYYHGEIADDAGLDECEYLKKFVHGAQPSRHYNESERVFCKQDLADKEIL